MPATTITVSPAMRKTLEALKRGSQTYEEVLEELLAAHPSRLTWEELDRRFRTGERLPIEDLVARARSRRRAR